MGAENIAQQTAVTQPCARILRIGIVFAAFPAKDLTPYKYFVLLLNRLQRSCEFELFDFDAGDPFVSYLLGPAIVDGHRARTDLSDFGQRIRESIRIGASSDRTVAHEQPDQLIVVTGVTLSDYHYLIRRGTTTMLALGEWDRSMSPPSLAEFLQLLLLRAPYSALEGAVWDSIHLGTRACIFDYTDNLQNTRHMVLAGVGVCNNCEAALAADGFPLAASEIRRIAAHEWRGNRAEPGTPANIMARLGYDLFVTKGFEASFREKVREAITSEGVKEFVKFLYAVLLAWLIYVTRWKT